MGDMGNIYRDMKDWRRLERQTFGMKCPKCQQEQPQRQPTVLLPGASCWVHRPYYVDPRPRLTQEDYVKSGMLKDAPQ